MLENLRHKTLYRYLYNTNTFFLPNRNSPNNKDLILVVEKNPRHLFPLDRELIVHSITSLVGEVGKHIGNLIMREHSVQ